MGLARLRAPFRPGPGAPPRAAKMPHSPPKLRRETGRGWPMRLVVACCALSIAVAAAGCSSTGTDAGKPAEPAPAAPLPLSVGNGVGSQYGNYAAEADGETRGPAGERCVVFNWDRPLTPDLALRVRSESCESKERPGWMLCRELSRTVIPIAASNLKAEQDETER